MKFIRSYKLFEAESGSEEEINEINDILSDCIDLGIDVLIDDPDISYYEDEEYIRQKIDLEMSYETQLSLEFKDIRGNIEHLINYMKSNGYTEYNYSDPETQFNREVVPGIRPISRRENLPDVNFILPNDNDGVGHPILMFYKILVYKPRKNQEKAPGW